MQPFTLATPILLEMVFGDSSMAAAASRIPHTERSGDRRVTYSAQDAQQAYDVCSIALVLAGAVARGERL
jgi:D-aminopeptidase